MSSSDAAASTAAAAAAASTCHFITLRPYLEILSVTRTPADLATNVMKGSIGAGAAAAANHAACLLDRRLDATAAAGADLVGLASAASAETAHLLRKLQGGGGGGGASTLSSLILLLGAGGFCYYLIFKKKDGEDGEDPTRPRSRWRPRGWLWWIFGDEGGAEDLVEESVLLRGSYFGPNSTLSPERVAGMSSRGSAADILRRIAEKEASLSSSRLDQEGCSSRTGKEASGSLCPNCQKCACRKRMEDVSRLLLAVQDLSASTTTSSSDSPAHPIAESTVIEHGRQQQQQHGRQQQQPATSTPELADDEGSDISESISSSLFFIAGGTQGQSASCCQCRRQRDSRSKGDGADSSIASSVYHRQQQQAPKLPKKSRSRTAKLYSASRHGHHHQQHRHRLPPLGQERWSASPVLPARCDNSDCLDPLSLSANVSAMRKEESVDSIASLSCGSMADLVKGAREVRRLIREASFDSLASDFSLDMRRGEELGASTELNMQSLHGQLQELQNDCSAINERVDVKSLNVPKNTMTSSKSDFSVCSATHVGTPGNQQQDLSKEASTPDLRILQKPKSHFWKINDIAESEESSLLSSPLSNCRRKGHRSHHAAGESLEWESPNHGWHDLRKAKYKLALGSSRAASEYGGDEDEARSIISHLTHGSDAWEWDCEGLSASAAAAAAGNASNFDMRYQMLTPTSMLHHQKWLPESADRIELDLETELASSSSGAAPTDRFYYFHHHNGGGGSGGGGHNRSGFTSRSSSRRSSFGDRSGTGAGPSYYAFKVRQPPSGRSSVEQGSGDTPRNAIDHASLVKSFGVNPEKSSNTSEPPPSAFHQPPPAMVRSCSSDESGFQEGGIASSQDNSTSTVFTASGISTLSPVHEAREPTGGSAANTPLKKSRSFSSADDCGRLARGKRKNLFANRSAAAAADDEETLKVVINKE